MRRVAVALAVLAGLVVAALVATCGDLAESPSATGGLRGGTSVAAPSRGPAAPRSARTPRARGGADAERATVGEDAPTQPEPDVATGIRGRVLEDADGASRAVVGAVVELCRAPPAPVRGRWLDPTGTDLPERLAATVTGGDGAFEFEVPAGRWIVVATAPDGSVVGAAGEGAADLDLHVAPGATHRLVVVDDTGAPLAHASALLFASDQDAHLLARVQGDANGRVVVRAPSGGAVVVTAPDHGFARAALEYDEETVVLPRGLDVAGVVVDERGAPWPGAELVLEDAFDRLAFADEQGAFRFPRVGKPGALSLWTYADDAPDLREVAAGDEDVRVVLRRRGPEVRVSLRLVLPDGGPASGALLSDGTVADGDGRISATVEGGTRAFLHVGVVRDVGGTQVPTHSGYAEFDAPTADGAEVEVRLREVVSSFFRVRVVDPDGAPMPDAQVHARRLAVVGAGTCDGSRAFVVDAPSGSKVMLTVAPKRVDLYVPDCDVTTSPSADCEPTVLLAIPLPAFRVRVLLADGTEVPPADWRTFRPESDGVRATSPGTLVARPGTFTKLELETGGRRFAGYLQLPSAPPFVLDVRLPPAVEVRGRAVDSTGAPAAGTDVTVHSRSGASWSAVAGDDGRFVVGAVDAGRATLVVSREGGDPLFRQELVLDGTTPHDTGDLTLWDEVRVHGRAVVPPGTAACGLVVRARWAGDACEAVATTDASGRFALRVPAAADAVLVVRRAGRLCGVAAIPPGGGAVAVDVRPLAALRLTVPRDWDRRGFDVLLECPPGGVRWRPETETDSTLPDAVAVTLRDVPAGPCRVLLRREGASDVVRDVTAAPGDGAVHAISD